MLEDVESICSVDSGFSHNLFLDHNGNVYSCGKEMRKNDGLLGREIKSETSALKPTRISGLPKIISVAASFDKHSLFLDEAHNVWACGSNVSGELSLGKFKQNILTPVKLPINPMKSITAGWRHSLFLDEEGTRWVWGNNNWGELGLGDNKRRSKAQKVQNLPCIKEIFAGCQHTMFLGEDGSVWGTGYNSTGELGSNKKGIVKPVRIDGLPEIKMIALGWNHSLFLDLSGGVWACGSNSKCQLGMNNRHRLSVLEPELLPNLPEIQMIAAGGTHSLFVDVENSLWACGSNDRNQLGNTNCDIPQMVANVPKVRVHRKHETKSARNV